MTRQIENASSLVGSSAGSRFFRLNALTAAMILAVGGAVCGFAQEPATQPEAAKPTVEKKPAPEPKE